MKKLIHERTMFKVLIEKTGLLFSVTTRNRAYFFFASTKLFGIRISPTTDPYQGIVEMCNYDLPTIIDRWGTLANIKLMARKGEL